MPSTKLIALTDAAIRAEFILATELAGPGAADSYHAHWKLVAAEMTRRGLKA